jgi:acyl CoA:acetate/3-ketoacid CoA transferase beta subunit
MELIELAPDVTVDDIKRQTEGNFRVRQGVG